MISRNNSSRTSSAATRSLVRVRTQFATLALLILFFAWFPSQTRGQDAQSGQPTSIQGTVTNSVTHEPIGHAQVYSQDNRFATMTDDQGHFEVSAPQPQSAGGLSGGGGIPLIARKPGFLADQNSEQQIAWVVPGATQLSVLLVPEAIIMGRIALPSLDSPDGIQVQLFRREVRDGLARWTPRTIATTNSKGEYRFAELYPGDYRVGTHEVGDRDPEDFVPGGKMFGYPPVYFPEASDFLSANIIHLSPGKVFQADFSLARRQYYPIKISVANGAPDGAPINISVSARGDGVPGYSLGYNSDRTIRGMLPNGIYLLEASSYSQPGATSLMNLRVENAPVQEGSLTLLPNGSIDVRVKEEFTLTPAQQDTGVGGADRDRLSQQSQQRYLNVTLEPFSDFRQGRGAYLRQPTGRDDKSLVIDNVAPGRYWVRVNSSREYPASVSSGGVNLLREPLVVGFGGSAPPIEITMRDEMASLDGSLEGLNGEVERPGIGTMILHGAGAPAYVYCVPQPDSPGQFTQVWAAADGKINPQQIVPGVYRILAFKHQQQDLEYRNPKAMRAYESKGQIVRLNAGQTEHVSLQLISRADEDAN